MTNLIAAFTIGLAGGQADPSLARHLEVALGEVGVKPEQAHFEPSMLAFFRSGEMRTAMYDGLYLAPWTAGFVMRAYREQLATTIVAPNETISICSTLLGQGTRRHLLGDPVAVARGRAESAGLTGALEQMRAEGLIAGAVPSLADMPEPVQRGAAIFLFAAMEAVKMRRAAFDGIPDLTGHWERLDSGSPTAGDPEIHRDNLRFMRAVDTHYLFAAGQDLAAAVEAAQTESQAVSETLAYSWRLDTAWGAVELTGGGDSAHSRDALLIIDTGGNDGYLNLPATRSLNNWLSATIDTAGSDSYRSGEIAEGGIQTWPTRAQERSKLGPCAARLGFALLFDSSGRDVYRTHRAGLGSATFGVAMLVDEDGDDKYESYADALGFGHFGIGAVDDYRGNDAYDGFNQVQGVGLTAGFGLLIDRAGSDSYTANDAVIDFPSPQSAEHNVSMAQGAGYGFRADYLTGHSLSGGIGVLCDLGGDDRYACGVFGQGVGYWEGIGALWDRAGADTYSGQWYVQGAAAHFGIGYCEDVEGNDAYTALLNMAQGAGHDFSIGYLLDRAGDDVYKAPNLSLGAGNANGIGLAVDFGGNDSYDSQGTTLGMARPAPEGSLRERALSLGLFIDLSGNDSYPSAVPHARNTARVLNWMNPDENPLESQFGVFWDR